MTTRTLGRWCAFVVLAMCMVTVVQGAPLRMEITQSREGFDAAPAPSVTLRDGMREAWIDHCVWSRMVIVGMFNDLEGTKAYEERLFANVEDLEGLLARYYGDGAVKFGILFEEHVLIGGKVLSAIRSGDEAALRSVEPAWYENAQQIADLLWTLNPEYWDRGMLSWMWRMHLDMVLSQAFAHKNLDWRGDVSSYDKVQAEALEMADYLSRGILLQFPYSID